MQKQHYFFALFALSLCAMPETTNAAFGKITYFGSGCPMPSLAGQGSHTQNVSSFKILATSFEAAADAKLRSKSIRQCQILLPIDSKKTQRPISISVTYQGNLSLPHDARASLRTNYSLSGERAESYTRHFSNGQTEDWSETDFLNIKRGHLPCGSPFWLLTNASILTETNAYLAKFSLGGSNKPAINIHVQWEDCEK